MRLLYLLIFSVLPAACALTPITDSYVEEAIARMIQSDQTIRKPQKDFTATLAHLKSAAETVDKENTIELKKIIDEYGVPKTSRVGEKTARFFATLVLHMQDMEYKKKALKQMESLLKTGDTSPANYAYLYDRIAVTEKKPQKWGTQGECTPNGGPWKPDEVEDEIGLDARRKAIGLPPMQGYTQLVNEYCQSNKIK